MSTEELRKRLAVLTLAAVGVSGLACIAILIATLVMEIRLVVTLYILIGIQLLIAAIFLTLLWFARRADPPPST